MATASTSNSYNLLPRASAVSISTANPARDGTGALGTVLAATGNGARVELIRIVATGPVSEGMIRLFFSDAAGAHLISEINVPATMPSDIAPVWQYSYVPAVLLVLPSGTTLKASTEKENTFRLTAFGWSI